MLLLISAAWPCLFLASRKCDLLLTWAVLVALVGAWLVRIVSSVHFLEMLWRDSLPQRRFWKTPFFLSQFIPGVDWLFFALACVPPLRTRGKLAKGLALAFFPLSLLYAYGCTPWNGLPFCLLTPLRMLTILLALLGAAFLNALSNSSSGSHIRTVLLFFTILVLCFHTLILVGTRNPKERAYHLITRLHDLHNYPVSDAEQSKAFYAPATGPDEMLFAHLAVLLPADEAFARLADMPGPFSAEQAREAEQLLQSQQDIFDARDTLCLQQPPPKPLRVFGEFHPQNYAYQTSLDNWQKMYQVRFRLALYRRNAQAALKNLDMMDGLARIPAGNDIPGQIQAIRFTLSRLELLRVLLEADLLDDIQLAKQQATLRLLERQCGESAARAIRLDGAQLLSNQMRFFSPAPHQGSFSPDVQAVMRLLLAKEHLRQLQLLPQREQNLCDPDFRPKEQPQASATLSHHIVAVREFGQYAMLCSAVPLLRMQCRMAWLACSVERWRLLHQGNLPLFHQIPGANDIQDAFAAKPFSYIAEQDSLSYRIQGGSSEKPPISLPFQLPVWHLSHRTPVAPH
ncbi:MAG: hypothetical protein IJJ33_10665 [Victivallales bacterium]|nr:hypothetical protein [Victivallales bacterium]